MGIVAGRAPVAASMKRSTNCRLGNLPLAVLAIVLEHLAPGERIFVWGTRTANIYLDAQARPACRYILAFPLTGRIFGGPLYGVDMHRWIMPGAWSNLEQDFNKHPPTYIVDLRTDPDPRYQLKEFPILTKLLTERYQEVASTAEGVIYRMR
jgi:hypothetical protein